MLLVAGRFVLLLSTLLASVVLALDNTPADFFTTVRGPAFVGKCARARFYAEIHGAVVLDSPNPLTYTWTLNNVVQTGNNAWIDTFVVEEGSLAPGSYTLRISFGLDWKELESYTVFTVTDDLLPLITISSDKIMHHNKAYTVNADIILPHCVVGVAPYQFKWSVFPPLEDPTKAIPRVFEYPHGDNVGVVAMIDYSQAQLHIPTGVLIPGQNYDLQLEVMSLLDGKLVTTSNFASFACLHTPVKAIIANPNIMSLATYDGYDLIIDASQSHDPTMLNESQESKKNNLKFQWACALNPVNLLPDAWQECKLPNGTMRTGPELVIPAEILKSGVTFGVDLYFRVYVTSVFQYPGGPKIEETASFTDHATVMVQSLASAKPFIRARLISSSGPSYVAKDGVTDWTMGGSAWKRQHFAPHHTLRIFTKILAPVMIGEDALWFNDLLTYSWAGTCITCTTPFNLAPPNLISSPNTPSLTLKPYALLPGNLYEFTVKISDHSSLNDVKSDISLTHRVLVDLLPQNGTCTGEKMEVREGILQPLLLTCAGWVDHVPEESLSYSFSYNLGEYDPKQGIDEDGQIPLTGPDHDPFAVVYLPFGIVTVTAKIIDGLGSYTMFSWTIRTPAPLQATQPICGLIAMRNLAVESMMLGQDQQAMQLLRLLVNFADDKSITFDNVVIPSTLCPIEIAAATGAGSDASKINKDTLTPKILLDHVWNTMFNLINRIAAKPLSTESELMQLADLLDLILGITLANHEAGGTRENLNEISWNHFADEQVVTLVLSIKAFLKKVNALNYGSYHTNIAYMLSDILQSSKACDLFSFIEDQVGTLSRASLDGSLPYEAEAKFNTNAFRSISSRVEGQINEQKNIFGGIFNFNREMFQRLYVTSGTFADVTVVRYADFLRSCRSREGTSASPMYYIATNQADQKKNPMDYLIHRQEFFLPVDEWATTPAVLGDCKKYLQCSWWDEAGQGWESDGCAPAGQLVEEASGLVRLQCACNRLGTFTVRVLDDLSGKCLHGTPRPANYYFVEGSVTSTFHFFSSLYIVLLCGVIRQLFYLLRRVFFFPGDSGQACHVISFLHTALFISVFVRILGCFRMAGDLPDMGLFVVGAICTFPFAISSLILLVFSFHWHVIYNLPDSLADQYLTSAKPFLISLNAMFQMGCIFLFITISNAIHDDRRLITLIASMVLLFLTAFSGVFFYKYVDFMSAKLPNQQKNDVQMGLLKAVSYCFTDRTYKLFFIASLYIAFLFQSLMWVLSAYFAPMAADLSRHYVPYAMGMYVLDMKFILSVLVLFWKPVGELGVDNVPEPQQAQSRAAAPAVDVNGDAVELEVQTKSKKKVNDVQQRKSLLPPSEAKSDGQEGKIDLKRGSVAVSANSSHSSTGNVAPQVRKGEHSSVGLHGDDDDEEMGRGEKFKISVHKAPVGMDVEEGSEEEN